MALAVHTESNFHKNNILYGSSSANGLLYSDVAIVGKVMYAVETSDSKVFTSGIL